MKTIFFGITQFVRLSAIKSTFTRLLCLMTVVTLSGCAFYTNINSRTANVDMAKNGIVIISLQESSRGRMSQSLIYRFENVADETMGSFSIGSLIFSEYDFTLPRVRGDVFAVELPPGQYTLTSWTISTGNAHISPRIDIPAFFTVEQGKAIYLGSIDMQLEVQRNFLGMEGVYGGIPYIQDKMDRDMPIAIKKFSVLGSMPIEKSIISFEL